MSLESTCTRHALAERLQLRDLGLHLRPSVQLGLLRRVELLPGLRRDGELLDGAQQLLQVAQLLLPPPGVGDAVGGWSLRGGRRGVPGPGAGSVVV